MALGGHCVQEPFERIQVALGRGGEGLVDGWFAGM
jgi:hypothetical protein